MNPFARWFAKRRLDRELAAEMAEHVAEKIEQLREEGQSEAEARALALRQFGNLTLQQESSRSEWGWNAIEQVWQDTRFAARVLRKTPGFTLTAILVLGLGIGMNTAMFSAIRAVLLSALPYPEPERMVSLAQVNIYGNLISVSSADFHDWRAQSRSIAPMAAYTGTFPVTLTGDFRTRSSKVASVGAGFFDVVATHALIGRTFGPVEQKPGAAPTLVLSYELASAVFGMPASAIQKTVHLNGLAFTIIGVLPPKFDFPNGAQVWIPNDAFPEATSRSAHNYRVFGRLRPGVSIEAAQSDMNVVAARLGKVYADDKGMGIRVASLYDALTGSIRPAFYVLWGAVLLVLLIACVNISNLQLARAAARRKEMGMRTALGAVRGRLIRQLLTENILLAALGGALGLGIAELAIRMLRVWAPANIPRIENLTIDPTVLLFSLALSLLAGMLFGLLPALNNSRTDLNEALKQTSGKGTDRQHKRWGQLLVAGEIALALILLSGASLLLKSYWKLAHVDTGLASGGVYLTGVAWPASADGNSVDGAFVRNAGAQILAQVKQLPGVRAAALVNGLPFGGAPDGGFEIEGRPLPADPHQTPDADYRLATADYFKVFGIPILRGRGFTLADEQSAQQVAIVNERFAKQFFSDEDALGKRIRFLGFDPRPQFLTIVGVIPDVRASFKQTPGPEVYAEYLQHADTRMQADLVVRGPATLQPKIEQIVTSLDRFAAVHFESMDQVIYSTVARERFQTTLLGIFAATALLLALIGIYGLLSYMVTRRTSEMGVRIALGASRSRILLLILREGIQLAAAGAAIGLLGSLFATRALGALLDQANANSFATVVTAAALFALAVLAACYLPAARAARVDPAQALRTE